MDRDVDAGAVTRERLVHRVVHDLVDEVMQPPARDRADVHRRAAPHRLQALEDLDRVGLVAAVDRKSTRLNSSHSQISYAVFCLKKKTVHGSASGAVGSASRTRS